MAFPAYKALVFPHTTGGIGVTETVVLTVTANDGSSISNPVTSVASPAAYQAADATGKSKHERFSEIVLAMRPYGQAITVASTGTTITMGFELPGTFTDGALAKPAWFHRVAERPNAYELAQAFVAANSHNVTAISVTVNGTSQSS